MLQAFRQGLLAFRPMGGAEPLRRPVIISVTLGWFCLSIMVTAKCAHPRERELPDSAEAKDGDGLRAEVRRRGTLDGRKTTKQKGVSV